MYVSKHIDWLSITVLEHQDVEGIIPSADWHYVGAGRHGYKSAYDDRLSGAHLEADGHMAQMGYHLTLSGQVLACLRGFSDHNERDIIHAITDRHARISRVDLAINAHEGKLTVRDYYRAHKSGALHTDFRRAYYVEGIGHERAGDTFYLGSPKSDRQLRIYDKAAEQGVVDGKAWLRLELALRDLRAKAAIQACGDNPVGEVISAHLVSCIQWQQPEHREMVGSLGQKPVTIPRPVSNRQRWLRDQCAPALAKEVALNPGFMAQFLASFQDELDRLSSHQ